MQRYKDDLMTINVDQNDEPTKQQLSQDAADQIKFSGESRRRFATSGLAASGIILTLTSRSVLGASVCLSPSGFISGNTSTHGDLPLCEGRSASFYSASTDSKGSKASFSSASTVDTLLNAKFKAVFPNSSNPLYDDRLLSFMLTTPWPEPSITSVQVQKQQLGAASLLLSGSSRLSSGSSSKKQSSPTSTSTSTTSSSLANPPGPTQELLKHLVVAFLNARNGYTPFLTEATIQSIFNEWQASGGNFSPTAGVTWDTSQIIKYLSLTQDT